MKTVKVMSIIGIILISISLMFAIAFLESDLDVSAGWGIIGLLYSLPFSIVALVQTNNASVPVERDLSDLIKLNELKEEGIITEAEFNAKKSQLLMHI